MACSQHHTNIKKHQKAMIGWTKSKFEILYWRSLRIRIETSVDFTKIDSRASELQLLQRLPFCFSLTLIVILLPMKAWCQVSVTYDKYHFLQPYLSLFFVGLPSAKKCVSGSKTTKKEFKGFQGFNFLFLFFKRKITSTEAPAL